jgi:hypothetical protein
MDQGKIERYLAKRDHASHEADNFRRLNMTCGNCQLLCHPDREERTRRHTLLTSSGVVIQHSDGSLEAVSPERAREHLARMSPAQRAMYETM